MMRPLTYASTQANAAPQCTAEKPPPTTMDRIFAHMKHEGFRPSRTADNALTLRCDRNTITVQVKDGAPLNIRLAAAFEIDLGDNAQLDRALHWCNAISVRNKGLRAYTRPDRKAITVDFTGLWGDVDAFLPYAVRRVEFIRNALHWLSEMQENPTKPSR